MPDDLSAGARIRTDLRLIRSAPPRLSELRAALELIERSDIYTNYGPVNASLEHAFVDRFGSGACLTVSSATVGLMLAMKHASHRRPGRTYAVMPSFTFAATAQAALWAGLTPVLCDIDPTDWLASEASEQAIMDEYGERVAVMVPCATFAQSLDLSRYRTFEARYGCATVLDAAPALGTLRDGVQISAGGGALSVFSMHATKAFATFEGGVLHSDDPDIIHELRGMGNFGFSGSRSAIMPGLNSKLSEVSALLGLEQIDRIDEIAARRTRLASVYRERLAGFEMQPDTGEAQAHMFMPVLLPRRLAPHRGGYPGPPEIRGRGDRGLLQSTSGRAALFRRRMPLRTASGDPGRGGPRAGASAARADERRRRGPGDRRPAASLRRRMTSGAIRLYDAFSAEYDQAFDTDVVRAGYEQLGWELLRDLLPEPPGLIVDAGCGTGRGIARLLDLGHRVIGVEPAPGMQDVLRRRFAGAANVELLEHGFEDAPVAPGSADAVVANGSLQYAPDPEIAFAALVRWVRPGGLVCVQVDGLVNVVMELIRQGRVDEAIERGRDGWGAYSWGGESARVRLFDRVSLTAAMHAAGLRRVEVRGLLVSTACMSRQTVADRLTAGGIDTERALTACPGLADAGKHLMAWGLRA